MQSIYSSSHIYGLDPEIAYRNPHTSYSSLHSSLPPHPLPLLPSLLLESSHQLEEEHELEGSSLQSIHSTVSPSWSYMESQEVSCFCYWLRYWRSIDPLPYSSRWKASSGPATNNSPSIPSLLYRTLLTLMGESRIRE